MALEQAIIGHIIMLIVVILIGFGVAGIHLWEWWHPVDDDPSNKSKERR
jgi:hypothetical protein